jgi:hypothetical protein
VAENIDFFPIDVKQKPNRKPIRFGWKSITFGSNAIKLSQRKNLAGFFTAFVKPFRDS